MRFSGCRHSIRVFCAADRRRPWQPGNSTRSKADLVIFMPFQITIIMSFFDDLTEDKQLFEDIQFKRRAVFTDDDDVLRLNIAPFSRNNQE